VLLGTIYILLSTKEFIGNWQIKWLLIQTKYDHQFSDNLPIPVHVGLKSIKHYSAIRNWVSFYLQESPSFARLQLNTRRLTESIGTRIAGV
jgi:hypothetical protein